MPDDIADSALGNEAGLRQVATMDGSAIGCKKRVLVLVAAYVVRRLLQV